jgi:hypothetical protein
MPLEIKELHIRASVVENKSTRTAKDLSPMEMDKIKREVIRTCVQEVMQILENKKER